MFEEAIVIRDDAIALICWKKAEGVPSRAIKPSAGRLHLAASTLPPAQPAARSQSQELIGEPANPFAMASERVIGKLSVRLVRGANLVIADPLTHTSDPYVVLSYGSQKVKSSVQKKNANPLWNEVLLLPVTDPTKPVKLEVFDEDKFTADDSMGVAEFNVTDIYDAAKLDLKHATDGTRIKTLYPVGTNYLGGDSHVSWKNGKVVQDLYLKLKNVESGSVVLQLEWVHVPGVTL